jgi:hypothetical protein
MVSGVCGINVVCAHGIRKLQLAKYSTTAAKMKPYDMQLLVLTVANCEIRHYDLRTAAGNLFSSCFQWSCIFLEASQS